MSTPVLCAGIVADLSCRRCCRRRASSSDDRARRAAARRTRSLGRLGVAATVAGKVGEDVFGDFLERTPGAASTPAACAVCPLWHVQTVVLTVPGEDRRLSTRSAPTPTSTPGTSTAPSSAASMSPPRRLPRPAGVGKALAELFASPRRRARINPRRRRPGRRRDGVLTGCATSCRTWTSSCRRGTRRGAHRRARAGAPGATVSRSRRRDGADHGGSRGRGRG